MRAQICFFLLLLSGSSAWAQETGNEWRYLASRQEAQAVLAEKAQSPAYNKAGMVGKREFMTALFHFEYDRWRHGLEAQLRDILGSAQLPAGFSQQGRLNLDLCCYRHTSSIDGLRFEDKEGSAIILTTHNLLRHWLGVNKTYVPATPDPAADPDFYQWTGASEGSVLKVRDLPNGALLVSGGPRSDTRWIAMTVRRTWRYAIVFMLARTSDPAAEAASLAELLTRP